MIIDLSLSDGNCQPSEC